MRQETGFFFIIQIIVNLFRDNWSNNCNHNASQRDEVRWGSWRGADGGLNFFVGSLAQHSWARILRGLVGFCVWVARLQLEGLEGEIKINVKRWSKVSTSFSLCNALLSSYTLREVLTCAGTPPFFRHLVTWVSCVNFLSTSFRSSSDQLRLLMKLLKSVFLFGRKGLTSYLSLDKSSMLSSL